MEHHPPACNIYHVHSLKIKLSKNLLWKNASTAFLDNSFAVPFVLVGSILACLLFLPDHLQPIFFWRFFYDSDVESEKKVVKSDSVHCNSKILYSSWMTTSSWWNLTLSFAHIALFHSALGAAQSQWCQN